MRKLVRYATLLGGVAFTVWQYWQSTKRETEETWAAGTDRID